MSSTFIPNTVNNLEQSNPFKRNGKPKKVLVNIKRVASNTNTTTQGEPSLQVHVKMFGKVQQIKKKIKKMTGIPIVHQVLILAGRQIDNSDRVIDILPTKELEMTMFLVVNKGNHSSSTNNQDQAQKNEPSKELSEPLSTSSDSSLVPIQHQQREEQLPSFDNQSSSIDNSSVVPETVDSFSIPIAGPEAPVIKISFEDQHRRLPFEGYSFAQLTTLCTLFFGVKNPRRMLLHYKDEEGDWIQISTDAELAYALQHHSSDAKPRVLKLQFSLKQLNKNKKSYPEDNDSTIVLPTPVGSSIGLERKLPMRKLQEGDVIQLSNGGLHLVLSKNELHEEEGQDKDSSKKIKKPQFVVGASSDDSEASHWIVEKVLPRKKNETIASTSNQEDIVFLKNKKCPNKSHLRVSPTGEEVNHNGATGIWARLCVEYVSSMNQVAPCIRLRSIGRSQLKVADAASNAFIGIVQDDDPSSFSAHVVRGNLNKDDKRVLFNVRFI